METCQGEDDAMRASSSKTILLASFQQNIRAPLIRYPHPLNNQIDKWSILEAADGGTRRLIVEVPAHRAIASDQGPGPGGAAALSSTPKESVVPNIVEGSINPTSTTWESRKAA